MKGNSSPANKALLLTSDAPVFLIIKGCFLALLLAVVLLAIFAAVMYRTETTERIAPYVIAAVSLFSIFTGSFFVGRKATEKGWMKGGLTGFCYVLILFVLSFLLGEAVWHLNWITKLFLGFSLGAVGGMLGINT